MAKAVVRAYVDTTEAEEILKKLKALRTETHDQTMRTQIIHLLYADGPHGTETRNFLESEIDRLEARIQSFHDWANGVNNAH